MHGLSVRLLSRTHQMSSALSSFAAELAIALPAEGQWKCMTAGAGHSSLPLSPAAAAVAHDRVACVGMLLCERDRHVMRKVLDQLDAALKHLLEPAHSETAAAAAAAEAPTSTNDPAPTAPSPSSAPSVPASAPLAPLAVDLLISLRASDLFCWRALLHFRPRHVRHVWLRVCAPYDSQSFVDLNGLYHTDGVLDAILAQRNAVRAFACSQNFEWMFWLDSDILLRHDTLSRCVQTGLPCVGSHYQPRWAMHSVVAVAHSNGRPQNNKTARIGGDKTRSSADTEAASAATAAAEELTQSECEVQLLIDPHLLAPSPSHPALAHPCVVLGFGAMLVRRSLLSIEYALAESLGGVKGEDVGFCLSLLRLQESRIRARSESCRDLRRLDCAATLDAHSQHQQQADVRPHFLAGHIVEHLAGGKGTTVKPALAGGVNTTFVPLIARPAIRATTGETHAGASSAQVLPVSASPPSSSSAATASPVPPPPPYAMLTRVRSAQIFSLEAHVQVAWECVAPSAGAPGDLQAVQRDMSGAGFYRHVAPEQLESSSPPPITALDDAGAASSSSLVRLPAPVLLQPLHHFPLSCSRMLSSVEAAMSASAVKDSESDSDDEI